MCVCVCVYSVLCESVRGGKGVCVCVCVYSVLCESVRGGKGVLQ